MSVIVEPSARAQDLLDPGESEGVGPLEADRERIAPGEVVLVGRGDPSSRWVDDVREFEDGQVAVPLIPAVPRHRQEPAPMAADRRQADGLPADVAGDIGPDQVHRRGQEVSAGLAELRPARGLIEPQAGQVGRGPRLEPGGAERVGPVVLPVLMQDRAMPRELQWHLHVRLPLDRDRLAHHPHRLPGVPVAVADGSAGSVCVDIQVLLVDGEDREAPRPVPVVPDRDPGQRRLAGADHVPARRDEVDPVPERGQLERAVRVVRQERDREKERSPEITQLLLPSIERVTPASGLHVLGAGSRGLAPTRGLDVLGKEAHRGPRRLVRRQEPLPDRAQVECAVGLEARAARMQVQERLGPVHAQDADELGMLHLARSRSGRGRCGGRPPPRATRAPA